MPNAFSQLDTSFPSMDGKMTEAKLQAIRDDLYQLMEQFRYTLNNLGAENFNETGLKELSEPVCAEIRDLEGNVLRLELTAAGLTTRVENAEGDVSALEQDSAVHTEQLKVCNHRIADLEGKTAG